MYEKFNNNFQNTTMPQGLNGINPYQDQYFGEYDTTPYVEALHPVLPGALPASGPMANSPYPLQASLATPTLSSPVTPGTAGNYAKGGEIKEKKRRKKEEGEVNPYPSLAELIREEGQGGDTILAHINPIEAMILKELGGSGTINPVTGLPQFGWWNPIRNMLVKGLGAVVGNMILPGAGGMIGGALTGAAQHKVLGKKAGSPWMGALQGLGIGAALPSLASLGGSAASGLGMGGLGSALSGYGATNAILPALGLGGSGGGGLSSFLGGGNAAANGSQALSPNAISQLLAASKAPGISATGGTTLGNLGTIGATGGAEPGFMSMLGSKSKDFFSSPGNLLAITAAGSQLLGQKSPRKQGLNRAKEEKAYQDAMKGGREERLAEAKLLHEIQQAQRGFKPSEPLGNLAPLLLYRKQHSPQEQQQSGRWFSYYDNPALQGGPVPYKKGGAVEYIHEEYESPRGVNHGLSHFLQGMTGGQDDKIPAMLSDGEYVIDASTVADLGDGNNEAGAKNLDIMVKNIRKHKGGSTKLPPKAKSIKTYMRRKK